MQQSAGRGVPTESTSSDLIVEIVRLPGHDDLPTPEYQTEGSAGADLRAAVGSPLQIAPGEIHLVPTGLRLAIPAGFEGQVRPRSGLAVKGLTVVNAPGTIDSDYRGEIKVILTCIGREPVTVNRGDRIAQIVFCPVHRARFANVASLDETARGEGGFGHTGT